MNIDDSSNHPLIGPSSAWRVLNCPVSFVRMNPATEEGTKAHSVLEAMAKDDYRPDYKPDNG